MYDKDLLTMKIINEYQKNGCVCISLNQEGPSAESIGLYAILDCICEIFNFTKSKIRIITCNAEEIHDDYHIDIRSQHWFSSCLKEYNQSKNIYSNFSNTKCVSKYLFGCLYNTPNWNRLSILSYIKFKTKNPSLLSCNISMKQGEYNTLDLNTVIAEAPTELYNIVDYVKTGPRPLTGYLKEKPLGVSKIMEVTKFYSEFFIDIVAETYSDGLTFFVSEKTIRPILAMTPFIVFGPQGFLSNLKARYGFKTFSRWWDESYDNYSAYDRIKKIYQVIDYLDALSINDREKIYYEMQDVLDHNFKIIQNNVY
jgi:hypothetical protein